MFLSKLYHYVHCMYMMMHHVQLWCTQAINRIRWRGRCAPRYIIVHRGHHDAQWYNSMHHDASWHSTRYQLFLQLLVGVLYCSKYMVTWWTLPFAGFIQSVVHESSHASFHLHRHRNYISVSSNPSDIADPLHGHFHYSASGCMMIHRDAPWCIRTNATSDMLLRSA